MSTVKLFGQQELANIPWEDRPEGSHGPLWRYSRNPVIPRDLVPTSNSIFNSAVVPYEGRFAGVFRCDDWTRRMELHVGFSDDGLKWDIAAEPLQFTCDDPEIGRHAIPTFGAIPFLSGRTSEVG